MWKCMRKNNKVSSQDENEEADMKAEHIKTLSRREGSSMKKERLKIQGDKGNRGSSSDGNYSTSGSRKVRLLVTKGELKRILSYSKNIIDDEDAQHTSLAQLLSDVMLREKRTLRSKVEQHDDGAMNKSWRPALESIPEDRSMK